MSIDRQKLGAAAFWVGLVGVWAALAYAFVDKVLASGADIFSFEVQGRTAEMLAPEALGLGLLLPLLWIIARYTLSDLPRYQRAINTALRAAFILALVGALSQVVLTSFESRVSTIFLVDTSASMPDDALAQAVAYVEEARAARGPRDELQVIAFARQPYRVALPEDGPLTQIPRPPEDQDQRFTDLAAALRMAYGLFPQDHLKRAVIISDGNQTRGDFLGEAHRARNFGIRLFHHEVDIAPRQEVLIQGVEVPDTLKVGQPFTLTARVFSSYAGEATLTLWQNDLRSGTKTVDLEAGVNDVTFETEVSDPGFRQFDVRLTPSGPDHFADNNRFVYSASVRGKPRVLYVEGEMRASHYLQRALRNENFEVEVRGPFGLPDTLEDFEGFDLVLVSDLPATRMSNRQMKTIDRYVNELGGGFIVAGGESSFGPGGYYGTYLEDVLPVEFEPRQKRETPSLALALVIDKSGSMSGERIELAKEAARATVEILDRDDRVGVTAFDDGNMPLVRMQSASNRVRILSDISRLQASGGTNIAGALQKAYEDLALTPARLKHIILLTDGHSDAANIFSELLPAMRIEGITVSTVAVGAESETTMLRRIAEGGGGRYYYTANPYNIPRIFMKETSQVSRSSMVEEPFRAQVYKRAQVLQGIPWQSAPYLLGYVSTTAKPRAEVLLVSEYKEPILARWRRGLGKVAAFTSDLKNRWAVQWVRWPGYSKFWAQLIRDTMRTDDRMQLAMRTEVAQGRAQIVVDAVGEDDRFINDLTSQVAITGPDGALSSAQLTQTAAGRYEADVELDQYGSYSLKAQHDLNGETIAVSFGSVSYPYPREYRTTEPRRALLRRAADAAGGSTNPAPATLFDPMGEEVKYREELWPYFLMAALGLLVLDLALRRIRLSGATALSWEDYFAR